MATKKKDAAVVDDTFTMIKYPGKGGWTYISIPDFGDNKKTRFAYRKINLVIDGLKIDNTSIWKMKNGNYFLPVKAEIRKKIGKQDGDSVRVQLYKVPEVLESDEEILLCLKEEPAALKRWKNLPDEERTRLTDWILTAPKEQIKVDRLADLITGLISSKKLKM